MRWCHPSGAKETSVGEKNMGSAGSVTGTFSFLPDAFKETDTYRFYKKREIDNLGNFYEKIINSGKDIPESYKIHFLDLGSSFQSFQHFFTVSNNF